MSLIMLVGACDSFSLVKNLPNKAMVDIFDHLYFGMSPPLFFDEKLVFISVDVRNVKRALLSFCRENGCLCPSTSLCACYNEPKPLDFEESSGQFL